MTRLVTLPVTKAEAAQRAGRAGRLGPGSAYRLWSRAEDATLRDHPEPEIEVADLAPLALDLAAWGAAVDELAWLTPPPEGHLAAARDLLGRLGALDDDGIVTAHGRLHGLDWGQRSDIDRLAPQRLGVPSGNRHRVDYSADPPVLAVKLQELFGSSETPTVADGRVPVVLHLLSPAGRPLQVTQDLASFWAGAYADVRADMRGRYPKHPWPADPATATPTAGTKPRR